MIKYINTEVTPKEDIKNEIRALKGTIKDDDLNFIVNSMYDKYGECIYKVINNSYVAFRPKESQFWIENPKNDIVYVESHTTPKDYLLSELTKTKGYDTSLKMVNDWYDEFSAFVFDTSTQEILFSLSRYRGTWSENMPSLIRYKM